MKNIFLLLLSTVALEVYPQNPYQDVTTVSAGGMVFNVELSKYKLTLSNVSNTISHKTNLYYQDGRELETADEYAQVYARLPRYNESKAIREAFGDAVIESLRIYNYSTMRIFYAVGPDGTTLEVCFSMDRVPELMSLAPEVFAALERNLKKYVKWEVNEFSRQLQFLHMISFVRFQGVPLTSELSRPEPEPDPGSAGAAFTP